MGEVKPSLDKFRGCLIGALLGDCLGSPFEGVCWVIQKDKIMDQISPKKLSGKAKGSMLYTDDTAMSNSVCSSLLHCKGFNPVDMATRFAEEFMAEQERGYGMNVVDIFYEWHANEITNDNVMEPSAKQFNGSGSFGNGGAMRVAPVALFAKSTEECIDLAKRSALLTHSNRAGYVGAIFQALAVYKSLYLGDSINWKEYLEDLKTDICKIESELTSNDDPSENKTEGQFENMYAWTRSKSFSYTHQLGVIEELLTQHFENPFEDDKLRIATRLGKDVSAQQSVPAALYSFLKNIELGFEETLYYAISLGGDTDTIGSMCAAIAGAYYGYDSIPTAWKEACESHDKIIKFADSFYQLRT